MTQLYRHFDAHGKLLYVGISQSALLRLHQHKSSPWFNDIAMVRITHFKTRGAAIKNEAAAIRLEHPAHNDYHTRPVRVPASRATITRLLGPKVQFNTRIEDAIQARIASECRRCRITQDVLVSAALENWFTRHTPEERLKFYRAHSTPYSRGK